MSNTEDELDKKHIGVDITKVELSDIDWDLIRDDIKLVFTAKEFKAHTDKAVLEADDKAHLIGWKNGMSTASWTLDKWAKHEATVTTVQGIKGIKDGQYVKVKDLQSRLATLKESKVDSDE